MGTCNVVLTLESVDKFCTNCFVVFYKILDLGFFLNFDVWHSWNLKG